MPKYNRVLKEPSRELRQNMTDAERTLWAKLRRKQLLGVQFYHQRPIERFIVDFYAHNVGLVIEVDGAQHLQDPQLSRDRERTAVLESLGLKVIRFSNLEVLKETDAVMERIYDVIKELLDER